MAGSIKGITIEIDGDTRSLQNSLKDVDKESKKVTNELKQIEKSLKFDPGNIELLAQKQELLSQEVQTTTTRLDRLRAAQAQVEQQAKSGEIGADQFRAFQREVIKTESRLGQLKSQLASIDDTNAVDQIKQDLNGVEAEANNASDAVAELAAGMAGLATAGGGLSGAIETAMDSAQLQTKIDISFNVPEESKKSIKDAVKAIQSFGIDGVEALDGVRRQWALNKKASDEANAAFVKNAATIAYAYADIDFTELIEETNQVASALKISNEQALGMVDALLSMGFPVEQLDILSEYGTQLKTMGYTAQEIQTIFANGINLKAWNIDSLIDGIKEGRLQMVTFAQELPKSIKPLLDSAGIGQKQFKAWAKAIAEGGSTGAEAMGQIVKAVQKVDDETVRANLSNQIWRTLFEDNGENLLSVYDLAGSKLVDLNGQVDQLGQKTKQINESDPMVQWNQSVTELKEALTPLLDLITQLTTKISEWIANNPTLAATILAIVVGLGILAGLILTVVGVIAALTVAFTPLTGTILAVIAVVTVLGTWIVWLALKFWDLVTAAVNMAPKVYQKFIELKDKAVDATKQLADRAGQLWDQLVNKISTKASEAYNSAKSKFDSLRDDIKSAINDAKDAVSKAIDKIKGFFSGLKLSFPKISMPPLPHFSLSGSFSLNPPSVPKLSVNWYKKGGLFAANSPQVIGVGDASTPEAVLPLNDRVLGTIAKMIGEHMQPQQTAAGNGVTIIIQGDAFLDNDQRLNQLGNKISQAIQRETTIRQRAQGVRTYGT